MKIVVKMTKKRFPDVPFGKSPPEFGENVPEVMWSQVVGYRRESLSGHISHIHRSAMGRGQETDFGSILGDRFK